MGYDKIKLILVNKASHFVVNMVFMCNNHEFIL